MPLDKSTIFDFKDILGNGLKKAWRGIKEKHGILCIRNPEITKGTGTFPGIDINPEV
jgi:hypothetical protein